MFCLICMDRPESQDLRLANRPDHLAYLKSSDAVAQAGPLLNAEGGMIGSLIILDVPDMAGAEDWAAHDPYAKAGLFADVQLIPWNRVIG